MCASSVEKGGLKLLMAATVLIHSGRREIANHKKVTVCTIFWTIVSLFKEAAWVDRNRAELIQKVTSVMPIADQMLQQGMIHKERYAIIEAAPTSMEKMRELYKAFTCPEVKSAFYRILQDVEPVTHESRFFFNSWLVLCLK